MWWIFSRTKKIKKTHKVEALRDAFREDYDLLLRVGKSYELTRFQELDDYVNDTQFVANRRQIEELSYKRSPERSNEKRFKKLLKNRKLRTYFKVRDSATLRNYLTFKESELYQEYAKLKSVVLSQRSFDKKSQVEEFGRFKKLHKSREVQDALYYEKDSKYRTYLVVSGTGLSNEFDKLSKLVQSNEFQEKKAYLLNKKRYLTTEDYKLFCEYVELKNNKDLIRYFALIADSHFMDMTKWKPVFSDEFDAAPLDTSKWLTKYAIGEKLLKDTYAVGNDVHLFIGENVELLDSRAKLSFKKEQIVGKYWNTQIGIVERSFDYTSGMLNSAASFQVTYGKFEAKIKIAHSAVKQTFWMKGDDDNYQVVILESSNEGLFAGTVYRSDNAIVNNIQRLDSVKLYNGDYIFTFEWTKEKMEWRINDTVVKELSENIPKIPMYIGFSLSSLKKVSSGHLPAEMEIDWVRCYKLKPK
ncbi:hypothetical protein FACS1894199_05060 [Bacteroidia bacterium]|nr:hypothetical protein FACS1894199_05060 [Bacteroidia bacterium]